MSELTNCQNNNESCGYAKLRAENASLKEVISLSEDSRLMDEYLKLERAYARQAERIIELEKERDGLIAGVKVSIPTDSMEQEFSSYHRRGYEAGKRDTEQKQTAEIERLRTEVSNLTSQLLEADEFVAELQDQLER